MNIYLANDNKKEGPFTLDQIKEMVQQGKASASTLAWHDGITEWTPLGALLNTEINFTQTPPPLPQQEQKNPGLGLASFWIAIFGIPFWITLLTLAAVAHNAGEGEESGAMIALGLILFAGVGLNALGLILGGIAATAKDAKLVLTLIGTALNLCQIVGIIGIIILGLIMG